MQERYWIKRYWDAGFSFFHTGKRDKSVATSWTKYQTQRPTKEEVLRWLKIPYQNYGIVCGKISNLTVIDVDTKSGADPTPFLNRGMYEIRTPSHGYHFYTRYNPLLKTTHKKDKKDGILQWVDIQSDGAIVFAPPTSFPGKGGYTLVNDAPIGDIPQDLLVQMLEAIQPEKEAVEFTPYIAPKSPEMGRPGDIFNALASWEDVLIPCGWTKVGRGKEVQFWRRPGKVDGVSASTNWKGYDLFFPYTTSVEGLIPKKGYTKFHLLSVLKYDGDFRKAAKSLVMENYRIAQKLI